MRWVLGSCFVVEFIEMDQPERVWYNATVDKILHQQAACRSRADQTNYSHQPGGVNWYREKYGVSTTPLTVSRAVAGRRIR